MSKVATQLIVFGEQVRSDLAGVLATVADAGYDGVETGLLMDVVGPRKLGHALAGLGLGLAGCHGGFEDMSRPSALLDYVLTAGGRHLICSGVGDRGAAARDYEAAADVFNKVGEIARDRGAVFCYHNHSWEFKDVGGRTGMDILIERTDPGLVKLCIDTFWVADAGQDPTVFVHRQRKRMALIHLKDGKPGERLEDGSVTFRELGHGELDFPAILSMAALARPEWLTVEQDRSALPPEESARRSREYLEEIGY